MSEESTYLWDGRFETLKKLLPMRNARHDFREMSGLKLTFTEGVLAGRTVKVKKGNGILRTATGVVALVVISESDMKYIRSNSRHKTRRR